MRQRALAAKWQMDGSGYWLMIQAPKDYVLENCDAINCADHDVEITRHTEHRSLDANAYFWVLCGKLAAKVGRGPDEIYRDMIKDVGDNYDVVPVRVDVVQRWIDNWQSNGIGWICEDLGESKIQGYNNTRCYIGSSRYDTKQMHRLIDLIVQECRQQDIETMSPDKIERMCGEWDTKVIDQKRAT